MNVLRIMLLFAAVFAVIAVPACALDRPDWMDEPGIVMAGSWEAPVHRARLMGRMDYTLPPEKQAEYEREQSAETIAKLKELGVNFLMIPGYKGAGLKTEQPGMEDAKRFAALAHQSGMRVGAYIGGTLFYERLFDEEPDSPQWQDRDANGNAIPYTTSQKHRHMPVRHHPGYIDYLKKPVRFAIEEMRADLVHFDNLGVRLDAYDPFSKQQFREYLRNRGMPPEDPPMPYASRSEPLVRAWKDYKCQALTAYYAAMSEYIRGLNERCAVECNPGAVGRGARANIGVDPPRLLPLGNAFWDESFETSWSEKDGLAQTRIRTLKIGELYNNSAFLYCESALDLAESMAFNVNCLGCVAWFEWGKIVAAHWQSDRPPPEDLKTYIRFFLDHQDFYRKWNGVADVAVLRTFAEQAFGAPKYYAIEQALIQGHTAWRIIFDQQLDDLAGYRVLVAPDDQWLTPDQREKIARFARQGGRVVRSTEVSRPDSLPETVRDSLRVIVKAPRSVVLELRQQPKRQRVQVHLVNYAAERTIENVAVKLRLKKGRPQSVQLLSPDPATSTDLPFECSPDGCTVVVPALKVYALLIIDGIEV